MKAPSGWEFSTTSVTIALGGNNLALSNEEVTATEGVISFIVTAISVDNPSSLAFSGIKVRPTGKTPSSDDDNICLSIDGEGIAGVVPCGDGGDTPTNFGTLKSVAGEVTNLALTFTPAEVVYGGTLSEISVTTQDQFDNPSVAGIEGETVTLSLIGSDFDSEIASATIDISGTTTFSDVKIGPSDTKVVGEGIKLVASVEGDGSIQGESGEFKITAKLFGVASVGDKEYDGNSDAVITLTDLTGIIEGDNIEEEITAEATFNDKNVGTGIEVEITSVFLTGAAAENYVWDGITVGLTASITPKPLTVTGITANNKTYDGTTDVVLTGEATLNGVVAGDEEAVEIDTITGSFDNEKVGKNKNVTVQFTLTGAGKDNYEVDPLIIQANITARSSGGGGYSTPASTSPTASEPEQKPIETMTPEEITVRITELRIKLIDLISQLLAKLQEQLELIQQGSADL